MDPTTFDEVAKLFAARRLSRRQILTRGGAGVAATGLEAPTAAHGVPTANGFTVLAEPAPDSTAIATSTASGTKPITFLFLQSFDAGSLVPKPGSPGRYTLTLKQGLGDTVYFSDRPAKVVGTVPTDQFLKRLGFFPAENPPNAALVGQRSPTHRDIIVVELFNPTHDPQTNTATYEVTLLQDWHKLEEQFQQTPDNAQQLPRDFTAAHLFIDDCPDFEIPCSAGPFNNVGTLGCRGFCWKGLDGCVPCNGWSAADAECNARFAACTGHCSAVREGYAC